VRIIHAQALVPSPSAVWQIRQQEQQLVEQYGERVLPGKFFLALTGGVAECVGQLRA
jgi:hypothetical protein